MPVPKEVKNKAMETIVPNKMEKSPIRQKQTKESKSPKPPVKMPIKTNAAILTVV